MLLYWSHAILSDHEDIKMYKAEFLLKKKKHNLGRETDKHLIIMCPKWYGDS